MKTTIDKYLGGFLVLLMMIMTLDVLWGVFTRYFLGGQASWTEELARFALIWIGILGAAYASGQRLHLAIELLKPKLAENKAAALSQFICWSVLLFALAVMVIGGCRLVYLTQVLEQRSAALRLPMALIYVIVPISGLLICYYQVYLIRTIRKAPSAY